MRKEEERRRTEEDGPGRADVSARDETQKLFSLKDTTVAWVPVVSSSLKSAHCRQSSTPHSSTVCDGV